MTTCECTRGLGAALAIGGGELLGAALLVALVAGMLGLYIGHTHAAPAPPGGPGGPPR